MKLSLAYDVAMLPKLLQEQLFAAAQLPKVQVDAMPGLGGVSRPGVSEVTFSRQGADMSITTTREPGATTFEHMSDAHVSTLASLLQLEHSEASLAAADVLTHQALGNDYIVSTRLLSARTGNWWFSTGGISSPLEALFFGGVKARMYRMVPLDPTRGARVSINVGQWFNHTATQLVPKLFRALAGALGPEAPAEETACIDHLFAIRAELQELLLARDQSVRLERREALGSDAVRATSIGRPYAGGAGNDLLMHNRYHTTAALNGLTMILDNLSWVVRHRDRVSAADHQIGFERMLRDETWQHTSGQAYLRGAAALPALRRAIALRAIRNLEDHRQGLFLGQVGVLRHRAIGEQMIAYWVAGDEPVVRIPEQAPIAIREIVSDFAEIRLGDLVLVRPRTIVDACLMTAVSLANGIIAAYPWSSAAWRLKEKDLAGAIRTPRQLRNRWQRALWGSGLISPGLQT